MNITNEDVTAYLNSMYRQEDLQLAELRRISEPGIPIIMRDTESLILSVLKMTRPDEILEIGTATGYSAAVMAKALPDCRVTTIESDAERYALAEHNFKDMKIDDRISLLHGDAAEILGKMENKQFGFIFIDAAKSHYRKFWDSAARLAAPKAVVFCDNILMKAAVADDKYDVKRRHRTSVARMREFLEYITDSRVADTSVLPVGDGVSISILNNE
ncbi:MAG: O-methyltransferase [Eubacteriaceae bacterium]|nr:O-methyltransferase [Eubacteriaceae bacterium]